MPPAYDYSDKIWWMPDFSQDSGQGIANLLGGFMSGYNVAKERKTETAKVDALNEVAESDGSTSAPVPRPAGNWFTDTIKGYAGIPAWQQEQADPIFDIKKKTAQVQLQGAELGVRGKQIELDNTASDQQLMGQVMADVGKNPNYLNELRGPIPFKTPQYQQLFEGMMLQNSRSLATRTKVADITEFNRILATLTPEHRATVQQFPANKDGSISPQQWQAVNLAAGIQRDLATSAARQAEVDALQRGDVATTTIKDNEVTQVFKPASESAEVVPKELVLGDVRIIYNPKTGAFQSIDKVGGKMEWTPAQLNSTADAMENAGDPRAATLRKFIGDKVEEFMQDESKKRGAATGQPAAFTAPSKVLKYNPQTGRIE